jgi:hypothetical protein
MMKMQDGVIKIKRIAKKNSYGKSIPHSSSISVMTQEEWAIESQHDKTWQTEED